MNTLIHVRGTTQLAGKSSRGSVLITTLIFSLIIAITLVGYLKLSTNSLKLAHRTYFADLAGNLAEAGTEEAVWSFNKLGYNNTSANITASWSGWTLGNTVADTNITSFGSGYTSAPTVTAASAQLRLLSGPPMNKRSMATVSATGIVAISVAPGRVRVETALVAMPTSAIANITTARLARSVVVSVNSASRDHETP